jgi:hypothetical protein
MTTFWCIFFFLLGMLFCQLPVSKRRKEDDYDENIF